MRYARLDSTTILEVVTFPDGKTPFDFFHPDVAPLFFELHPDARKETVAGWAYDTETKHSTAPSDWVYDADTDFWSAPYIETPARFPIYPTVTPAQFERLFTIDETIAILDSANRKVQLYWKRYTDRTLAKIDMNFQSVQDFIDLLISESIVAAERREDILDGVKQ